MNFQTTPAQRRAIHFIEVVIQAELDDDLHNPNPDDFPELLRRKQAAAYLGIGMKWLSDLSGNGPRGGKLQNYKFGDRLYWKRAELDAYREGCS